MVDTNRAEIATKIPQIGKALGQQEAFIEPFGAAAPSKPSKDV